MEYISLDLVLVASSLNIKAHTLFEEHFQALKKLCDSRTGNPADGAGCFFILKWKFLTNYMGVVHINYYSYFSSKDEQ